MQKHNYRWRKLVRTLCAFGLVAYAMPVLGGEGRPFDDGMQAILVRYLDIQEKLAADSVDGVAAEAQEIARTASGINPGHVSGKEGVDLKGLPEKIEGAAKMVSEAADIDAARAGFKSLSQAMVTWATVSRPPGVRVLYCDMAKAHWLQREGAIRNPYYGAKMLTCGQFVSHAGDEAGSAGHEAHPGTHGEHGGGHEDHHEEGEQCGPHGQGDGC